MEEIKIFKINIDELKSSEYNPRIWNEDQIQQLEKSIVKFGIVDPLIVNSSESRKNIVIGGHFRLFIAKKLGYKEVPVIFIDIKDIEMEKELNLRLNKNSGEFNYELLSKFNSDFLKEIGFNNKEIDYIFKVKEDENFKLEEEYEKFFNTKIKLGDMFILGKHKVICGHSYNIFCYEKLFENEDKAQLVFTDPPYNVEYDKILNERRKSIKIKSYEDNLSINAYENLIFKSMSRANEYSKEDASFYIFFADKYDYLFRKELNYSGWHISQSMIWLKNFIVFSKGSDYHRIKEHLYFGWKKNKKHFCNKITHNISDVINLDYLNFNEWLDTIYEKRESTIKYIHPCQKPLRLSELAIKHHSKQGDIVLDMFLGSGSTLLSCESLNRRCLGIEQDPIFIDIIINRWEKSTGKKAQTKYISY